MVPTGASGAQAARDKHKANKERSLCISGKGFSGAKGSVMRLLLARPQVQGKGLKEQRGKRFLADCFYGNEICLR
jgi:hypothetical protein